MLKKLLYRVRSSRLSRELSYSIQETPLVPAGEIPPDQGDESSEP